MTRLVLAYVRAVDRLSEWLGQISVYVVIFLVALGFANVVLRYAGRFFSFRLTSNLIIELQWYLYSVIFFFGFAYILKNGINVRVDFWYANQSAKRKAWIDFVGHLLSLLPFCIIALWVTFSPVLISWGLRPDGTFGTWELSPDASGLPRAPIKSMILVAFFTLMLQTIAEMIKLSFIIRGQEQFAKDILPKEPDAPLRIE